MTEHSGIDRTAGVGLVPEGRQVFPLLTVEENFVATAANRLRLQSPGCREVLGCFRVCGSAIISRPHAVGGEQQMLAVGRALMTNPLLLILDEATEGLAPVIRAEIWGCIGF